MITSTPQRIADYTARGWWGQDTLHSLLRDAAQRHPQRLAVADQPNRAELCQGDPWRLSYQQLDNASDNLASQLLGAGIQADDKLIVQLPNIVELVVTYYAASKIGAIVSPVPVQYGAHELSHIRSALDARAMITTAQFGQQSLAVDALATGLPVLSFGVVTPDACRGLIIDTDKHQLTALRSYQKDQAAVLNNANAIVTICWTSGTTGTPKGVPRSHNMWLATTKAEIDACDFRAGDLLLNPFPLVNMAAIGGFLFPAVLNASSLFLHHPLDPPLFLKQMQDEKITFTIAPPALLNQLAKSPDMWRQFDFSALRRVGSGSAPLAPWMIETFAREYGIEVINFYGSNEGICLLSTDQTAPDPEQRACMFPRLGAADIPWRGNVYDFAKTRVISLDDGHEITESNKSGELVIAGPTIFDGYYPASVEDDVFTEDGYFRTGDMVEICGDPAHYYQITGRCKDIINRGGVKISPTELDRLLEAFAGLKEVAVCAYADERLGEKVCVCAVPANPLEPPTLTELVEYLTQQGVAKFKLPERLELFTALPRNPMGKILRFALQDFVRERI